MGTLYEIAQTYCDFYKLAQTQVILKNIFKFLLWYYTILINKIRTCQYDYFFSYQKLLVFSY